MSRRKTRKMTRRMRILWVLHSIMVAYSVYVNLMFSESYDLNYSCESYDLWVLWSEVLTVVVHHTWRMTTRTVRFSLNSGRMICWWQGKLVASEEQKRRHKWYSLGVTSCYIQQRTQKTTRMMQAAATTTATQAAATTAATPAIAAGHFCNLHLNKECVGGVEVLRSC
jgi:hypothetical protein